MDSNQISLDAPMPLHKNEREQSRHLLVLTAVLAYKSVLITHILRTDLEEAEG